MYRVQDLLTRRAAASFLAFALCAGLAQATITLTTIPSSPINNGESPAVAAEVVPQASKTIDKVYLQYRFKDAKAPGYPDIEWSDWHNQEMSPGDGNEYNGFIPILPAGSVEWNVCATYTDGSSEGKIETIDANSYDYFHDMRADPATAALANTNSDAVAVADWGWCQTDEPGGTNFFANTPNGGQWRASGVFWAASRSRSRRIPSVGPLAADVGAGLSYPVLAFPNIVGAFIMSPCLSKGLGTISFGVHQVPNTTGSSITIQTTDSEEVPNENTIWVDRKTYDLPDGNYTVWFTNVFDNTVANSVKYVRIVRSAKNASNTGFDAGWIGIDGICAMPPKAEMETIVITDTLSYGNLQHDMKGITGLSSASGDFFVDDYGWQHDTSVGGSNSTNFFANTPNGGQWRASGVGWAAHALGSSGRRIPSILKTTVNLPVGVGLKYPVLFFFNLDPALMPHIRTPKLENGLGTFSFGARNVAGTTSKLMVQVAYTEDEPREVDWQDIEEYSLPVSSANYWFTNVINDISVTYARILRTEQNTLDPGNIGNGCIGIDDICVTPPTPDLVMKERMRNPGYPAVGQDVTVRCLVSNVYERIPAINRDVSVHYGLASSARASVQSWSATSLTYKCETNGWALYEGIIPAQESAGWLHYYFKCDFQGYYYISPEVNGMASPEYLARDEFGIYDTGDDSEPNRYGYYSTTNAPTSSSSHIVGEVRASKSRFATMNVIQIVNGGAPTNYPMTLVGDNLWQVSAPASTGAVHKAWFVGEMCYENDADDFKIGSFYYGHSADNPQEEDSFETPMNGTPSRQYGMTNGLEEIQIFATNKLNNGFMVYRLYDSDIDSGLSYTIRRGVFQNFDEWEVADQHYVKSVAGPDVGEYRAAFDDWAYLYAWPETATMAEDFMGVSTNTAQYKVYDGIRDTIPATSEFESANTETPRYWQMKDFRLTADRVTNSAAIFRDAGGNAIGNSNIVVQLNPDGVLYNSDLSISEGAGEVSAKARASITDGAVAYYKGSGGGSSWTYSSASALTIATSFNIPANDRANSHYYASIVFDYDPVTGNRHELRFRRGDSTDATDLRLCFEIWESYNSGTLSRMLSRTNTVNTVKQDATYVVEAQIKQPGSGRLEVKLAKMTIKGSTVSGWHNTTFTINSGVHVPPGGYVGFCAYDCAPRFDYLKLTAGSTTYSGGSLVSFNNSTVTSKFTETAGDWFFGGSDGTTGNQEDNKWDLDSGGVLFRRIPKKYVKLSATPVGESGETALATVPIQSLQYTNIVWDAHTWKRMSYKLEVASSITNSITPYSDNNCVVVDRVSVTPWRGGTRGPRTHGDDNDSFTFTTQDEQNGLANESDYAADWTIFEGWAVTNTLQYPRSAAAAFCPSQARTSLVQALYSPLMHDGIGTLKFDYLVTGDTMNDKIVYAVEYTAYQGLGGGDASFGDGDPDSYVTAATYTNSPLNGASYHSCDISTNYIYNCRADAAERGMEYTGLPPTMRLRIRIIPEASSPNATLWIDNAYLNDSPEETPDMWKLYNGRLATADADYERIYGKAGRTLYLNNSTTDEITESRGALNPFDEWRPYLQAPYMAEGIGEISFVYRAYDAASNITPTGRVSIAVCDDESKPYEEWTIVTNLLVSGTGYISFGDEDISYKKCHYMRLFTETNGYGRVCIDNVVLMEPALPSYDISSVELLVSGGQPVLSSSNVAVRAQISRVNPKLENIELFVSWHVTTNDWGYCNWWEPSTNITTCARLNRIGDTKFFVTEDGAGLPATDPNEVVQYVVWGIHEKAPLPPSDKYQYDEIVFEGEGVFKNPYGKIDLNKEHCWTNSEGRVSFSPYYFVFSCERGAVWFNEIWHQIAGSGTLGVQTYNGGGKAFEFVELAGREGIDLSGWCLNVYAANTTNITGNSQNRSIEFPVGTVIPNDANGWGFAVIGDSDLTNSLGQTPRCLVPIGNTLGGQRDSFPATTVAFELVRKGGIVEQVVYVRQSEPSGTYVKYPWERSDNPNATSRRISIPWRNQSANSTQYYDDLPTVAGTSLNGKGQSYSLLDIRDEFEVGVSPAVRSVMPQNTKSANYDPVLTYTNEVAGAVGNPRIWWWYPAKPTPGEINEDQSFKPIYAQYYNLEYNIIMDGGMPHGKQNGRYTESIIDRVESGARTSIVYRADQWYKIVEFTTTDPNVNPNDPIGRTEWTHSIPSMSGNIVNTVTFGPKTAADDFAGRGWTEAVLAWLRSHSNWSEAEILATGDYGDGDEYAIPEEYLMDTSPLLTTVADAKTDSISFDGDVLKLGVGLVRADGCTTNTLDAIGSGTPVTSGINGVVNIYGVANLADFGKSETKIAVAQIPAGSFNGTNRVDTSFNTGSLGLNFFKWRLEEGQNQ